MLKGATTNNFTASLTQGSLSISSLAASTGYVSTTCPYFNIASINAIGYDQFQIGYAYDDSSNRYRFLIYDTSTKQVGTDLFNYTFIALYVD